MMLAVAATIEATAAIAPMTVQGPKIYAAWKEADALVAGEKEWETRHNTSPTAENQTSPANTSPA